MAYPNIGTVVMVAGVLAGAIAGAQASEPALPPAPRPASLDLPCTLPVGKPLRYRHETTRDMNQGAQSLWRFKVTSDESFTFVSQDAQGAVVKLVVERVDWQAPSRGVEPPSATLMLVNTPIMIRLDTALRPVAILNWPEVRAAYVRGAEDKAARGKGLLDAMPPERRAAAAQALAHNLRQLRAMSVEAGTREVTQDMADLFGLCGARLSPVGPKPVVKAYPWISPDVPIRARGHRTVTTQDHDTGLLVVDTVLATDAAELSRGVQAVLARRLQGKGAQTVSARTIESIRAVEQVVIRETQHAEVDVATGLPRLMSFASDIAGPALQRTVFSQFKQLP